MTDITTEKLKREYWFPGGRHDPLSQLLIDTIVHDKGKVTPWIRLLFYLMDKCEPDGSVAVTLAMIRKDWGLADNRKDVHRAAAELKKRNLLAMDGHKLFLNPQVRYYGKFKGGAYVNAMRRYMKLRQAANRKERT